MQDQLGAEVTLIEGSGGVFDVVINKKLVYSKYATGKFPDEDQLIRDAKV